MGGGEGKWSLGNAGQRGVRMDGEAEEWGREIDEWEEEVNERGGEGDEQKGEVNEWRRETDERGGEADKREGEGENVQRLQPRERGHAITFILEACGTTVAFGRVEEECQGYVVAFGDGGEFRDAGHCLGLVNR